MPSEISPTFASAGFEIFRGVFDETRLVAFRAEADLLAPQARITCVRNLGARSQIFFISSMPGDRIFTRDLNWVKLRPH